MQPTTVESIEDMTTMFSNNYLTTDKVLDFIQCDITTLSNWYIQLAKTQQPLNVNGVLLWEKTLIEAFKEQQEKEKIKKELVLKLEAELASGWVTTLQAANMLGKTLGACYPSTPSSPLKGLESRKLGNATYYKESDIQDILTKKEKKKKNHHKKISKVSIHAALTATTDNEDKTPSEPSVEIPVEAPIAVLPAIPILNIPDYSTLIEKYLIRIERSEDINLRLSECIERLSCVLNSLDVTIKKVWE